MIYRFGDCTLDPKRRELRRSSVALPVEPQVFDLLVYLICNRDRVVSRDDIFAVIWGGRIMSESVLSTRINAVRRAIGDNGAEQKLIKTLPRKGVRFTGTVFEQEEPGGEAGTISTSSIQPDVRSKASGQVIQSMDATSNYIAPNLALPERPSIAVLPFTNMSGDPEQEYFADGIVEDIITALSRFPSLFVIARNSSFTYKGRAVDIKQVGRELGVRYVLEGSVRKAGNRVRIAGQLIQADSGMHVWAERYESGLEDIFALQDEMTASVVGALVPSLQRAEIERARNKPTESLDAYDLYLRGLAAFSTWTREGNDLALRLLERALELDPNFVPAIIIAENCWGLRFTHGWSALQEAQAQSERYARLAVELDPENAEALAVLARRTPFISHDYEKAMALAEQAVSVNPNSAFAWRHSGFAYILSGEPEKALVHFERALRLSPRAPRAHDSLHGMGLAFIQLGRDPEAISVARKSIQQNANFAASWRTLTAALALSGQIEEARKALARVFELDPGCSLDSISIRFGFSEKARARLFEGLRRAGMS